jgi:hypothetical protein
MFRGCFVQAAALPFDYGVGGFPAHLMVVAAGPQEAINLGALLLNGFSGL